MQRRRELMAQSTDNGWDLIYIKTGEQSDSHMLDVIAGQKMLIKWESPETVNLNGWVMNGYDCCDSIKQIRNVGKNGEKIIQVNSSGQVRVGGYATNGTFNLAVGSIVYVKFI